MIDVTLSSRCATRWTWSRLISDTFGSRTGTVGDYPRVYDAIRYRPVCRSGVADHARLPVIGSTQTYAAYQRWGLPFRSCALPAPLRCQGLRAKLATATNLADLIAGWGPDAVIRCWRAGSYPR